MSISFDQARQYLLEEQEILSIDSDFLCDPSVQGAILQAIIDAGNYPYSDQRVFEYSEERAGWIHNGGPNHEMPFRSHLVGTQKIIYEYTLKHNTSA